MNKEEIEYCGLKIVVNNETYTEYKGTLEEQIEILQQENKQLKEINEEHKKLNGELREENKKYKEIIDKAIEYINDNLIISSILDGKKYYTINNYSFDYRELLDILKEVE